MTEGSGWVLDWIASYVKELVEERHELKCDITSAKAEVEPARNSLIHFGSRYMLLKYPEWEFGPNNRVILTWYHGEYQSNDPETQRQFKSLKIAEPRIEKITTSCQASLESLLEAGIPRDKIEVIPIGVQVKQFGAVSDQQKRQMREKFDIPADAFCVGSFQKDGEGWGEGMNPKLVKGPDVLVDALEKLHQEVDNLMVILTGYSRGYVKSRLDELGIRYLHHELDDYTQIKDYYHVLDVYLIASRCEGGPVALMEAWASGIPVVSTSMGMPADYIRHRENGMLAAVENSGALAEHMLALKSDLQLRSKLVEQGLEDVQQLDWSCVVEQYWTQLYQPLLVDIK
ncbi:MAG: glycosyltransferase family 4 protein [Verrucomicrobiota bacterium]